MKTAVKPSYNPHLKKFLVQLNRLKPDPKNAREHSERNIKAIMDSLSRVGQQKTIIHKDGVILAGNGTWEAAKRLGWKMVAAIEFDGDEKKKRFYKLADNRSAELAEWNFEALSGELKDLLKMGEKLEDLGWANYEVENLLNADWTPPALMEEVIVPNGHHALTFTAEGFKQIEKAANKLRKDRDQLDLTTAQAILIICEEFLKG